MRLAWVTHHVARDVVDPWMLPGGLGGAEMTDAAMMEQAPSDIEIDVIHADRWADALDYDRVVITGTDLLTDFAMLRLADMSPLVWVHHQQAESSARRELFAQAKPFVTMSEQHSQVEQRWSEVPSLWCHGHIDLSEIPEADEKQHAALWAARNHPQKGLLAARRWARAHDIPLTELSSVPRSEVLEAMAEHEYFVFKPQGFDSCPRTLIEAEAAGCKIVTNDLAGRIDDGPIEEVMAAQAPKFWSWI